MTEVIRKGTCVSCGACDAVCPVNTVKLDNGTPKMVGLCIACQMCAKKTESGAITMEDNLPVIDYEKGQDFDVAVEKCPMDCFLVQEVEPANS